MRRADARAGFGGPGIPRRQLASAHLAVAHGRLPDVRPHEVGGKLCDWPGGHHLVSVAIHAASAVLLFLALRMMTGAFWPSAVVAALFAIHPLRAESVAWAAERKDVLSTLFWMLTMLSYAWYARRPHLLRYLVVIVALVLGVMSKSMLVTLPCVLALMDYWPLQRWRPAGACPGCRPAARRFPAWASTCSGWRRSPCWPSCWRSPSRPCTARGGRGAEHLRGPALGLPAGQCPDFLRRLPGNDVLAGPPGHLLSAHRDNPHGAAVLCPRPAEVEWASSSTPCGLSPAGDHGGGALVRAAAALLDRRLALVPGHLGAGDRLGPGGHSSRADRYTYIPSIGIFWLVVWGVCDLAARWKRRSWVAHCGGGRGAACLVLTTKQVSYWKDSVTLFTEAIEAVPDSYFGYLHPGKEYYSIQAAEEDQRAKR